jgi:hypothetical protein
LRDESGHFKRGDKEPVPKFLKPAAASAGGAEGLAKIDGILERPVDILHRRAHPLGCPLPDSSGELASLIIGKFHMLANRLLRTTMSPLSLAQYRSLDHRL